MSKPHIRPEERPVIEYSRALPVITSEAATQETTHRSHLFTSPELFTIFNNLDPSVEPSIREDGRAVKALCLGSTPNLNPAVGNLVVRFLIFPTRKSNDLSCMC